MGKLIPSEIDFGGKLFATYHNTAFRLHSIFWFFNPAITYQLNDAVVKILSESHSDYLDTYITLEPQDDVDVRGGKGKPNPAPSSAPSPALDKVLTPQLIEVPNAMAVNLAETIEPIAAKTVAGATFLNGEIQSLEVQYVRLINLAKSPEYEAVALLEKIKQNCKSLKYSEARIAELQAYDCKYLGEDDEWPLQ